MFIKRLQQTVNITVQLKLKVTRKKTNQRQVRDIPNHGQGEVIPQSKGIPSQGPGPPFTDNTSPPALLQLHLDSGSYPSPPSIFMRPSVQQTIIGNNGTNGGDEECGALTHGLDKIHHRCPDWKESLAIIHPSRKSIVDKQENKQSTHRTGMTRQHRQSQTQAPACWKHQTDKQSRLVSIVLSCQGPSSDRCKVPIVLQGIIIIRAWVATSARSLLYFKELFLLLWLLWFYYGPSSDRCKGPIVILRVIIIVISWVNCIFEGLDILGNSQNLAGTSKPANILIWYRSWLRAEPGGLTAPPTEEPHQYISHIWVKFGRHMYLVQTNKKSSWCHALNQTGSRPFWI